MDEASLAATLTLDQLTTRAVAAGAKVLLVGDHHQLAAINAGGAFGLLARASDAVELLLLWRFRNRWEAQAAGHADVNLVPEERDPQRVVDLLRQYAHLAHCDAPLLWHEHFSLTRGRLADRSSDRDAAWGNTV